MESSLGLLETISQNTNKQKRSPYFSTPNVFLHSTKIKSDLSLATKPADWNFIPGTHVVKGENRVSQVVV